MIDQSRRKFLINTAALGCSAAASPLITPVTFASAPWDNRLVVIVLRGAMDGLDVVRPYGDKMFAQHRPDLAKTDAIDLDGFYGMHSGLSDLAPLWDQGQLAFAHAVSTPYRNKRSHFDGQDLLEAGYASLDERRQLGSSGWLNRMLTLVPNVETETAYAVGQDDLLLLQGDAPHASWAPGRSLLMSAQGQLLLNRMYESDPLFHASAEVAIELTEDLMAIGDMDGMMEEMDSMQDQMKANNQAIKLAKRAGALAEFAADRLNEDSRIAAFSIGGWDTHRNQKVVIQKPLSQLSTAILTLREKLGANWDKTAVLCMTEFGRTVRQNGTQGTDHGTGGAMLMAGGAIRGGQVYGNWPGLADENLFNNRDLLPTADVRSYGAIAMRHLFGISPNDLERVVFPGLDIVDDPRFIL
ncbi:twin-arginine translocation pathway signal [Amylibacter kogurei]|uniref:Twin-arginine translocation pathway signal n=1 Tax=Paramylibacter kogurei TaxID=1889778 RepID=A0A2G5KC27_9RHOB|nr:DUF1501 domain-containing protein [Amylibacter kogurei]PIB26583.1 twin-arginine translocation pathway signal [Amylibacter kogurei]